MEILNRIIMAVQSIRFLDILDIIIVAVVIYKIYNLMKETRAEQLIKGIAIIFLIKIIASFLRLYTLNSIIEVATTYGIFTILLVFQPELRRMLEYMGRSNIFKKSFVDLRDQEVEEVISEIKMAVESLARQKIGALIVFEQRTGMTDIVDSGTILNAKTTSELLINIFIPNTPLHDGAVIIKGDKIRAAAAILPLTQNTMMSKELGTRHRAAVGITERSDALALVVSEETGIISVAEKGQLNRYVDSDTLEEILRRIYRQDTVGIFKEVRSDENED